MTTLDQLDVLNGIDQKGFAKSQQNEMQVMQYMPAIAALNAWQQQMSDDERATELLGDEKGTEIYNKVKDMSGLTPELIKLAIEFDVVADEKAIKGSMETVVDYLIQSEFDDPENDENMFNLYKSWKARADGGDEKAARWINNNFYESDVLGIKANQMIDYFTREGKMDLQQFAGANQEGVKARYGREQSFQLGRVSEDNIQKGIDHFKSVVGKAANVDAYIASAPSNKMKAQYLAQLGGAEAQGTEAVVRTLKSAGFGPSYKAA